MNLKKSLLSCFGFCSIFIGTLSSMGWIWFVKTIRPDSDGGFLIVIFWICGFIGWFELTILLDKKFKVGLFDHTKQLSLVNYQTPKEFSKDG